MNSVFSVLLKNIILISLLFASLIFVFTNFIGYTEVWYLFLGMGAAYVIAACFEAFQISRIQPNTQRYTYFTDAFVSKRLIKLLALTSCGIVLLYSGSIIRYLSFICFLIAFTEIVVTLLRYFKKLCFIAFEKDMVIVSTNKLETMFAGEIQKIETRHGLTYVVGTGKKTFTLRTDTMKMNQQFQEALENWIRENHLSDKYIKG